MSCWLILSCSDCFIDVLAIYLGHAVGVVSALKGEFSGAAPLMQHLICNTCANYFVVTLLRGLQLELMPQINVPDQLVFQNFGGVPFGDD